MLFSNEIGENHFEEINIVRAGRNYGWPLREGEFLVGGDPLPANDASLGFAYPVAGYEHDRQTAISSGFAYRGEIAALQGKFIFGDIVDGRVFYTDVSEMIEADDGDPHTMATVHELQLVLNGSNVELGDVVADALGQTAVSRTDLRLGMDASGELYLMTKTDGFIRKLVPAELSGDANKDGQVTGADLISVQQNYGKIGTIPLDGDADNDGLVTGADLISVQQNFGKVVAPVPEPTTAAILFLAVLIRRRTRGLA